jgi:Peptidase A4 family
MALAAGLWAAPSALADSTTSGNWAGYAAHRAGVHFRTVSGSWRVPEGSCAAGQPGYSSIWVGLGGYSETSNALEQTGTELDCTRTGRAVYSAWYEIVPAPAHTINLGVRGGDLMHAAVTVDGHRVTLALQDVSDHHSFRQTISAALVDTTSADWIVEAPSACPQSGGCFTLPLADFGAATISAARAGTLNGHSGGVTSRWWGTTEISLAPHAGHLFAGTADSIGARATPSALAARGSAFSVIFEASSSGSGQTGPPGPIYSGQLVHPRR